MSGSSGTLEDRIRFHYQDKSYMKNFMKITHWDSNGFESIPYIAELNEVNFPNDSDAIDDLAGQIGMALTNLEFSRFIQSINVFKIKTIKTTLENLVKTLEDAVSELWDDGYQLNQLFLPPNLRTEIRKRKRSVQPKIQLSIINFKPTTVRELGNNQIILSQESCFEKIYSEDITKQISIIIQRQIRKYVIDCVIKQKLNITIVESIAKIIVTDIEKD